MKQIVKVQEFFDMVMSSENLSIDVTYIDKTKNTYISPTGRACDWCIVIRGINVSLYSDGNSIEYLRKYHGLDKTLSIYVDDHSGSAHAINVEQLETHKLDDYLLLQEMK